MSDSIYDPQACPKCLRHIPDDANLQKVTVTYWDLSDHTKYERESWLCPFCGHPATLHPNILIEGYQRVLN